MKSIERSSECGATIGASPPAPRDCTGTPALRDAPPPRRESMYCFSVQREVETFALGVLRYAKADKHLDREEDDQAGDGIVSEDDGDPDALVEELTNVALQNARRSAVLLDREHPAQQ